MKTLLVIPSICLFLSLSNPVKAQNAIAGNENAHLSDDKAEAVIAKAIQSLGGDRYLQVRSQVGRGKYSIFRDNAVISFQSFLDVIVFPDKERTEFKGAGSKTIQTNTGSTGWVYDGDQKLVKVQSESQISSFKKGLRSTFDYLLRGAWYKGRHSLKIRPGWFPVTLSLPGRMQQKRIIGSPPLPKRMLYSVLM